MEVMLNLDDATPGEIRITEVETKRDAIQEAIEKIIEVNKEVLNEQLMEPTRLIILDKYFIKKTEQGLKLEVTTNICDSELDLEKMQLSGLETILKDYELWKEYRDKMELHKIS
jgi:hypothetical protein